MARFDKYLKDVKNQDIKKKERLEASELFNNLSLTERMLKDSLFFKYSAIFGKYFFFIRPIKNFSIKITRKILGKLLYYDENSDDEETIARGIFGIFYLTLILSLLIFDTKDLTPFLTILVIGIFATISNLNIARKYLTLGEIGSIPITSDEILSFLSWLILLMEAGMNLFGALDYYVSKESNNLSFIFNSALKKVKTGEVSLDKALGELAIEVQRNDLREILTLILQSKQQGVPIKDALYSFFERYQEDIQSLAEKKGASANQKATFMLTAEVFLLMMYFIIAMVSSLAMF